MTVIEPARPPDPRDDERFARYGSELATAVDDAVVGWFVASVTRVATAQLGRVPEGLLEAARTGAESARSELAVQMAALLSSDVDEQRTTPLELVRRAGAEATALLGAAAVPPMVRDPVASQQLPDDVYAIGPASFVELSPQAQDAAIRWGAAKAQVHRIRHRPAGP